MSSKRKIQGGIGRCSVTDGRETRGAIVYRPGGRRYVALDAAAKTTGAYATLKAGMAAFDRNKAAEA